MLAYARMASRSYLDIEEPLRVGELVRLRSGGPVMTVSKVEEGMVRVNWHDKSGMVQGDSLAPALLRRTRRSFFGLRR